MRYTTETRDNTSFFMIFSFCQRHEHEYKKTHTHTHETKKNILFLRAY